MRFHREAGTGQPGNRPLLKARRFRRRTQVSRSQDGRDALMIFLHPGGGKRGRRLGLPPAASLFSLPHLPCPRGQAGPVIFQKVVQLMEKLVVEEEGLGGEGCFVECYPKAPWEDSGDQAAGPLQRLGGSGQLWATAAAVEAAVTFGVPGIPSAAANLPRAAARRPRPAKGRLTCMLEGRGPRATSAAWGGQTPSARGREEPPRPRLQQPQPGDAGGDLGRSEVAGVARAPGPARLAPSLGAWRLAGARRRRTDGWAGPTAGWAGLYGAWHVLRARTRPLFLAFWHSLCGLWAGTLSKDFM